MILISGECGVGIVFRHSAQQRERERADDPTLQDTAGLEM